MYQLSHSNVPLCPIVNHTVTMSSWLLVKTKTPSKGNHGYGVRNFPVAIGFHQQHSIYTGSILFEIFWLATIANQIQNWLAISDIV